MSTRTDNFKNHPFHSIWEQLLDLSHEESLVDGLDESTIQDLARLRKVITFSNGIIKNIDPDLFPVNLLTNLQKQSQGCINEINAYKQDKNTAHIDSANNHCDAILQVLHQTPASLYSNSSKNISEASSTYIEAIGAFLNNTKAQSENNITELKSSIDSSLNQLNELKQQLNTLDSEASTVTQTIQQQTSEFNTQYQSSEKTRSERFEKAYEKYVTDADTKFKDLVERTSKIIEVLLNLQDEASKVYGVTIGTLQGGAYSSYADEEKKAANLLRLLASLLMLTGVGFLVVPEVVLALKDEPYLFVWEKVLGRLPLSLVVFVPAFYFARESNKHRNNEIANRRRQHILTTLDPYLELMEKPKAQELKADVARTIFSESGTSVDGEAETSNLISQLANLVNQLKGK